jgi:ATP-dependent DNA helicase RecQ
MTPLDILKKYWGHHQFRKSQEEIIQSVLDGKDTLAILPTGGGKSVCFQVPAMAMEGMCLVISPLIALMEDQVNRLVENDMPAAALTSGMRNQDQFDILEAAANNELKFLYVSPERLQTKSFQERLTGLPISLVAVDEAHCISQWGYDFRPSYLNIAAIRENLKNIPLIALTASATEKVKEDIQEKLLMKTPVVFMTSFERKNLSYSVEQSDDKINKIVSWILKCGGSGIVYCRTRRRTKEISDLLLGHQISSDFYHAGLDQDIRKEKQEDWIKGKTKIIVCTNAFGMGIDKPDVRVVIHADVPDCLENYYQEAGRAGRDGNTAHAVLLYRDAELQELRTLPDIKFPSMEVIRKVYHALGNYFQLPTGSGKGKYFDFVIEDFIQNFKLNLNEVVYSLQALKQEQIISYLEKIFTPSMAQFISSRNRIEAFEEIHKELEPIIKALLRTYGGIFDGPIQINETQLAWILKRDIISIRELLAALHQSGIIDYIPKNDNPQICYLQERIKTEELNIDHENYLLRKKEYIGRIQSMIDYTQSTACRSVMIGKYFGDETITSCGICNNCKALDYQKNKSRIVEENMNQILHLLKSGPTEIKTLSEALNKDETQILDAICFLKNEGVIWINQGGKLEIK